MSQLKFLVCLTTRDNDYQRQQAEEAQRVAQSHGVDLTVIDGGNDAINQSQLLLQAIQTKGAKPNVILFEPVSASGLPHVAKAAVAANIAWGVLNREVDYMEELRRTPNAIVFGLGPNHTEIGRVQAAQLKALVPGGGEVLLVEGPSENAAARQRSDGFMEKKALNVTVKQLKGKWSEESGKSAVNAWLRLSTAHQAKIAAVVAQNDDMAMGARKALSALSGEERERFAKIPFLGVDGLPKAGQQWVSRGDLSATVIVPPTVGTAIEAAIQALRGHKPPAWTDVAPISYPEMGRLVAKTA